jgi:hypothetical protein
MLGHLESIKVDDLAEYLKKVVDYLSADPLPARRQKYDCLDEMMLSGGVVVQSPTDAALKYPNIFKNTNAVKMAFRNVDFTKVKGVDIVYQLSGPKQRMRYAVATDMFEAVAFKCWLEAEYKDVGLASFSAV